MVMVGIDPRSTPTTLIATEHGGRKRAVKRAEKGQRGHVTKKCLKSTADSVVYCVALFQVGDGRSL